MHHPNLPLIVKNLKLDLDLASKQICIYTSKNKTPLREQREREREEEIFQWIYTYRNGFAASSLRRGRVEAMPSSQEIFDVGPCRVHDAKSGDVDGPVLDHLALPSIVHYLIARKQADCNDCKSSRCRAPHFRLDVHWKRKVHRYGQFDKSNGLSDSEIALVPSSIFEICNTKSNFHDSMKFSFDWNFCSKNGFTRKL